MSCFSIEKMSGIYIMNRIFHRIHSIILGEHHGPSPKRTGSVHLFRPLRRSSANAARESETHSGIGCRKAWCPQEYYLSLGSRFIFSVVRCASRYSRGTEYEECWASLSLKFKRKYKNLVIYLLTSLQGSCKLYSVKPIAYVKRTQKRPFLPRSA